MEKAPVPEADSGESLKQLPVEQRVALILQQQKVIQQIPYMCSTLDSVHQQKK